MDIPQSVITQLTRIADSLEAQNELLKQIAEPHQELLKDARFITDFQVNIPANQQEIFYRALETTADEAGLYWKGKDDNE